MRAELLDSGAPETVIEDAVLILSELLSNSYRHARPLDSDQGSIPGDTRGRVRASWSQDSDGEVTVSVTDGGGPTRPRASRPSVTARGGRGLTIITSLSRDWGVRDTDSSGAVTVWAVLPAQSR